ncbi:nucleotidyltransferase family protein [Massilia sp. 9I]|uniref:nucleotidyltransferase family protein n=1 Tax=Massilia sp. 9I TaxID=2653152 RepID=UPI0012F408E7|nr:nucleotidyltransferase family protein [Massilia sp. 9I]VXB21152.1 conserved hypothetical protein [Massilia sp. 9I]
MQSARAVNFQLNNEEARMDRISQLQILIASDHRRMRVLETVKDLALPDCWVAAGFVRNCVWDHLHAYTASPLPQDIDVIWYDPQQAAAERDTALELALRKQDETLNWSVKNQARMHQRNADAPYLSATDAMRYWPETATAVGIRLSDENVVEIAAPYGLTDLFELIVRPTERFATEKHALYADRARSKNWHTIWPRLRIETLS